MSKLTDDDKSFCATHGLTYVPPDEPISLEEFEAQGPYFQNQGSVGNMKMWTLGLGHYLNDDIPEPMHDTSTSRSEYIWIALVVIILVVIAASMGAIYG